MSELKYDWINRRSIAVSAVIGTIVGLAGSEIAGNDVVRCQESRNIPEAVICQAVDVGQLAKDGLFEQLSKGLSDFKTTTE